jgi:hypothetical protein
MTAAGANREARMKYPKTMAEKEKAVETLEFDFLGGLPPWRDSGQHRYWSCSLYDAMSGVNFCEIPASFAAIAGEHISVSSRAAEVA